MKCACTKGYVHLVIEKKLMFRDGETVKIKQKKFSNSNMHVAIFDSSELQLKLFFSSYFYLYSHNKITCDGHSNLTDQPRVKWLDSVGEKSWIEIRIKISEINFAISNKRSIPENENR